MTEILIYVGFLAVLFPVLVLSNVRPKRGLTPMRTLDSSDVAHAERRRQRRS